MVDSIFKDTFFVGGPYVPGCFTFCHLLGDTPHYLLCNGITYPLEPSVYNALREVVTFAHLGLTGHYRQIPYAIRRGPDSIKYTGTFPFIPLNHPTVSFGFLSCNDNPACATIPGNTYFDGFRTGLFERLRAEAHDVVIHLGDNVYLDSVWDQFRTGAIDGIIAKRLARKYYIRSFGDAEQGACMRQGSQMQVIDDHDFMDGYGTPGYLHRRDIVKFNQYARLLRAVHDEFLQKPTSPSIDIGAYRVMLVDTRDAFQRTGQRFPPDVTAALQVALASPPQDRKFIVCLPQPLVHLDWYHAYIQGLFFSDGVDESEHPVNRDGARVFTRLLTAASETHTVFVASGDVHWAYIQDHGNGAMFTEMVTSGITRRSRSGECFIARAAMWVQRNFHFRRCTTISRNRRAMVLDHSFGNLRDDRFSIVTTTPRSGRWGAGGNLQPARGTSRHGAPTSGSR